MASPVSDGSTHLVETYYFMWLSITGTVEMKNRMERYSTKFLQILHSPRIQINWTGLDDIIVYSNI